MGFCVGAAGEGSLSVAIVIVVPKDHMVFVFTSIKNARRV